MTKASHSAELGRRLQGVSDSTVEAVGALSEALEWVERARGHLYDFRRPMGHADLQLGEARDELRAAGHPDVVARLETEVLSRNVVQGRWTS